MRPRGAASWKWLPSPSAPSARRAGRGPFKRLAPAGRGASKSRPPADIFSGTGPRGPGRITLAYAALASAWVVFSDQVLQALFSGVPPVWTQSVKGVLFVVATSALLYALVRRHALRTARGEQALRATLESMADAVVVVAANGCLLHSNSAAARLFGKQAVDAGAATWTAIRGRLLLPDGSPLPAAQDVVRSALQGTVTTGFQAMVNRPDGEPAQVSISAAPVPSTGEAVAVAVLTDVTELRRLSTLRDDFLATAAHELKTPIAAIKGYVQLLQRGTLGGREPREKAAFEVLNRQCDRITRVVQELLEVSRLRHSQTPFARERFDMAEAVHELVERGRTLSGQNRVRFASAGRAPVRADRHRIEQVVLNLIDNAVRFSPNGGDIEARVHADKGEVWVEVRDRGVGIAEDRKGRMFEPFYQAHAGTEYQHQSGLGIGLHMCRSIVERHGGRMEFESVEGQGSTFRFCLPRESEGAAGA